MSSNVILAPHLSKNQLYSQTVNFTALRPLRSKRSEVVDLKIQLNMASLRTFEGIQILPGRPLVTFLHAPRNCRCGQEWRVEIE